MIKMGIVILIAVAIHSCGLKDIEDRTESISPIGERVIIEGDTLEIISYAPKHEYGFIVSDGRRIGTDFVEKHIVK